MDERKKYTIARCLSDACDKDISLGRYLVSSLIDMIEEMKAALYFYHIVDYESDLKWIMTREVFNWIVCTCVDRQEFYYKSQYNSIGENKCELYNIEVEFVNNEAFHRNKLVELTYKEPDIEVEFVNKAIECVPWFKYLQRKNTEVKEEKLMKSFYVGCGKKVTIENVIFNNPATIVFWSDGTKTVVKRQRGDKKFDQEKGLAMAICKKVMGNKGNFNDIFKEWIEED